MYARVFEPLVDQLFREDNSYRRLKQNLIQNVAIL